MNTNAMQLGGRFALPQAAVLAALLGSLGAARAENAENPVTWNGLTLYGTIDVGVSYQSHGRPQNDYYSAGAYTFPNKASTNSTSQIGDNGLSQSVLGLRGERELAQGWSGLFKVESAINPATFKLTDSQKALTQNNGKPITQQTAAADNSITGPFSMAIYAGVKSDTFGQLTYGRQNTPLKDDIFKYDPLANASAFSAFGAFGTPAGGGSTENARLNNSIRYQNTVKNVRVDAIYASSTTSQGGNAWQLGLGSKAGGFSFDGAYAEKKGAVVAASLGINGTSPTSVRWLNTAHAVAGYNYANPGSVSINDALAGTVSDNTAWGLFAKYDFGGPIVSGGYEQITYAKPSSSRSAGFDSIGGYTFAIVNNGAYVTHKVLDVKWIGVKYPVTPSVNVMTAVYAFQQNHYAGNACAAPAATSPGTTVAVNTNSPCNSGSQQSYSLAATYKYNSYLDLYAGIMASHLSGGMASGFAHTSVYDVMTGVRVNF